MMNSVSGASTLNTAISRLKSFAILFFGNCVVNVMRKVRIWPITITGKHVMVCPNTAAKEVAMNTVMVRLIVVNPRQSATCLLLV